MNWLRSLLLVALALVAARAADIQVTVYGALTAADLDQAAVDQALPGSPSYLTSTIPTLFSTLHVGTVVLHVDDGIAAQVRSAYVLTAATQMQLVPVLARTGATYAITGWSAKRLTNYVRDPQGATSAQVLYEATAPAQYLPVTLSSTDLMLYTINAPSVFSTYLSDGMVLPSATEAANFRWMSARKRVKGGINGSYLAAGGANVGPLSAMTTTLLSSYQGAWVQFRERTTGEYRYQQQALLTHANPTLYDPVALDGQLLANGAYTTTPSSVSGTYVLDGNLNDVTFDLTTARLVTGIPSELQTQAHQLPPVAGALPSIDTTQSRGDMPSVNAAGEATGQKIEFYTGGQSGTQSTVSLANDIGSINTLSGAAAPADNVAGVDRINTATSGTGYSGKSQMEAMQESRALDYGASVTGTGVNTTISYGNDPRTGLPVQESLSGGGQLQSQDIELNKQVQVTYDDEGHPIDPQKKPLMLSATGTSAEARVQGRPDDIYSAADIVNAQIAPHMEGAHFTPKSRANHHGALIYPIDVLDEWGIARWGARTGVTVPDLAGSPIPGDGDNSRSPLPLGVQAFRPFYDFDDDGDLDRFYTDDPFDSGYKRLRVMWAVVSGVKQLSDFEFTPANNVMVTGLKKPTKLDDGTYAVQEDLLFHIGWNHKPFHHRVFKWRSGTYITYYTGSLITPLDPFSSSDRTLYQLALRNLTVLSQAESSTDAVSPTALIPSTATGSKEEWTDRNGDGLRTTDEVTYRRQTVAWYPGLVGLLDPADGNWTWSAPDFALVPGLTDRPGIAARITETIEDANGGVLSTRMVTKPWSNAVPSDPGSPVVLFDPAIFPVQDPGSLPTTPVSDTYMWDYPRSRSTAEGGTEVADADRWAFPWNVAWNGDSHSKSHSAKAFQLNSGNLSYFPPQFASLIPKITHAGLTADQADGGTMRVQFLLRESADQDPLPSETEVQWRDGQAHYGEASWLPGQEWYEPGRAPYHVFSWDDRTDMHPHTLANEGIRLNTGSRVYEVQATSLAEYLFRGKKYIAHTVDEQIALLARMWNYYFFGKEFPSSHETTFPSLCIPQRYDNSDLTSKSLNQAIITNIRTDEYVRSDSGNQDRAGDLGGSMLDELNNPNDLNSRDRDMTKRRVRLMNEQVFLFSAARGREWELDMARRMPRSTKLCCLEWEDKDAIKAILGRDGHNVFFPEVQTTYKIGPAGERTVFTVSSELDFLKQLSLDWFDGRVTNVGFGGGRMGTDSSFSPTGSDRSTVTNAATAVAGATDSFTTRLREGLPAAMARYAYVLRSFPMNAARQWAPDASQALEGDHLIEFRHPMLVLYHDRASAVYVHYGRNCDPDDVFGNWDSCAAPRDNLNVESSEFRRRQRFEAWRTVPRLEHIYDMLHPDRAANLPYLAVSVPEEPDRPGAEPQPPVDPGAAPTEVLNPGPAPTVTPPIWTRSRETWGGIVGGTTSSNITGLPSWAQIYSVNDDLQVAHDQWIAQFPSGGTFDDIQPQVTTVTAWTVVTSALGNPLANNQVDFYLGSGATRQTIRLAAPFSQSPLAAGTYTRAATNLSTGLATTMQITKSISGGRIPVTTMTYRVATSQRQNFGIDPLGGWAYVLGDRSHYIATGVTGNFPEVAPSFVSGQEWWNVFAARQACYIDFTLPAAATVELTSFSFDDTQVYIDSAFYDRYDGDIGWAGPIDRTWTLNLSAGSHQLYATTDSNGSGLGVRGLFVRIRNSQSVARAIADADLVAYRGYLDSLTTWNTNQSLYQTYLNAYAQWRAAHDAYLADLPTFQNAHATWSLTKAAHDQWESANAAILQGKARAQEYLADRSAWVSLVNGEVDPSGVSWSGDPSVIRSTLDEIRAITPQLPIWEAYGWTIDPVNAVYAVLSP